jgi:hypothetical protein
VPLTRLLGRQLTPTRLGAGRTAVGVVMLTRPALVPQALGVDRATADRMAWSVQMLGAREVALGLGAVAAGRQAARAGDRSASRLWLLGGLLADAVDALAVARAVGQGRLATPAGGALVAVAATAAGIQARELSRRS